MSARVTKALQAAFKDEVVSTHAEKGDHTAVVKPGRFAEVAAFLRDNEETLLDHFIDLTVVDWPSRDERFEVVVHLRSTKMGHRFRLKTSVTAAKPSVPSLAQIWKGANWFEREAWDMYGVRFEGHPDLRRILLWEGFEGHPLRKDYPKERRQCPIPFREDPPPQPAPFRERP